MKPEPPSSIEPRLVPASRDAMAWPHAALRDTQPPDPGSAPGPDPAPRPPWMLRDRLALGCGALLASTIVGIQFWVVAAAIWRWARGLLGQLLAGVLG